MAQGAPEFIYTLNKDEVASIFSALNLTSSHLSHYPLEVISTGLPYLIVPILGGIGNANISVNDFEILLMGFGAKFVYVLDVVNFEGRTWDNKGLVEDIATGSAAGPAAAFLTKHHLTAYNSNIIISQGRFLGRESEIEELMSKRWKLIFPIFGCRVMSLKLQILALFRTTYLTLIAYE